MRVGKIGIAVALASAAVAARAQTPSIVHILSDDSQVLVGRTLRMRAVVRDSAGNPIPDAGVTWAINQTQAGSISSDGVVSARGLATFRVTARSGPAGSRACDRRTRNSCGFRSRCRAWMRRFG